MSVAEWTHWRTVSRADHTPATTMPRPRERSLDANRALDRVAKTQRRYWAR